MNSFGSKSTGNEQQEVEQRETQTVSRDPTPAPTPQTGHASEKLSASVSMFSEIPVMEPSLPNNSELAYSCLLIPRFSDHYLTGDITEDLVNWMKEICISYGWRLDAITIRPGYMQWVMTVPLTANPAQFMKITRQQTSQKIMEDYPRFRRKNLSLDFWAPGFSVFPGNHPQSMDSINNFIVQIRRQQGIV